MYSVREALRGFQRARTATFVSISTITIALTLLGIFILFTVNLSEMIKAVHERLTLEIFIDNALSQENIEGLRREIQSIQGIQSVRFVSREDALQQFQQDFGQDVIELLGDNPLPASFQVQIRQEMRSLNNIQTIESTLESLDGVDDVMYHGQFFQLVEKYSRIIYIADGIIFIIALFSAIILIANTLRLTILTQKKTIAIMKLVGATRAFILRPYLFQGLFEGGIAGAIATLIIWMIGLFLRWRFPQIVQWNVWLYLVPFILGSILGLLGSWIGLKRFFRS